MKEEQIRKAWRELRDYFFQAWKHEETMRGMENTIRADCYKHAYEMMVAFEESAAQEEGFGGWLKESRGKLTLREVEEALGISNAYLSQLENNQIKNPSIRVVLKLVKFYAGNLEEVIRYFPDEVTP